MIWRGDPQISHSLLVLDNGVISAPVVEQFRKDLLKIVPLCSN
jgi:hypothetical protein